MPSIDTDDVRVLAAVLLVAVPVWAPALHLAGPEYRYESVELTGRNGSLVVASGEGDPPEVRQVDPFDCLPFHELRRRCLLEGAAVEGNVTGENPVIRVSAGTVPVDRGSEYVVFAWNSPVYRRTGSFAPGEEPGEDGLYPARYELDLKRVPPAAALADVARSPSRVSDRAMRAVRGEGVETHEPLAARGDVVAVGGTYHLVYLADRESGLSATPAVERALEGLCVAVGVLLLLRRP